MTSRFRKRGEEVKDMDATDMYQSQWLTAEDVEEKGVNVQIEKIKTVELQDQPKKLELHFVNMNKTLVLNATNGKKMIELFGKNTDDWDEKVICLFVEETEFKGKKVPGVRIRKAEPITIIGA